MTNEGLADALKFSAAQEREKQMPAILRHGAFDDKAWLTHNGTIEQLHVPPNRRKHTVLSVLDIVELSKLAIAHSEQPSIWVHESAVRLLFNDDVRRDWAVMPLHFTRQFRALRSIETGRVFSQFELIQFLRYELSGVGDDLIAAIRRIQWKMGETGNSSVEHGSSTLGISVEKQVSGAKDIPEEFDLQTVVWLEHPESSYTVKVGIDVVVEHKNFRLSVVGDQLHQRLMEAHEDLRDRFVELVPESVKVYLGLPVDGSRYHGCSRDDDEE